MPVSPVPAGATQRWWRWVIASTTDKWAERRAQLAMARAAKESPGPRPNRQQVVVERWQLFGNRQNDHRRCQTHRKNIAAPCRPWAGLNSPPNKFQQLLPMCGR